MKVGHFQNYINGEWVPSVSGKTITICNPCDGEPVTQVAASDSEDVNRAVAAAKKAFETADWAFNPRLRCSVLFQWAQKMRLHFNEIVEALSLESGKPLAESRIECNNAIGYMEYSACSARTFYGSTTAVNKGHLSLMEREPVGVVVGIEPWNYPITLMIRDSIPALATGNTLIIKPATQTSGASMKVIRLLEEITDCPKGVVNAITGSGSLVGTQLVEHPDVDMVTFTGGLETGKDIMRRAADTMKKVSLELGGKSANVVFADCDMDKALTFTSQAIFSNAGQTCTAGSRLVLDNRIADEYLARLKEIAENLRPGYCLDPAVNLGPVDSQSQMDKILRYMDEAKASGIEVLTGGGRCMKNGCENGFFIEPTIFLNPPVDAPIVQEELFGPVLVVQTFDTQEEAIALANCTRFGLASGLWTTDLNRAMEVSRRLRSGNVWVNIYNRFFPECETGGYKESGLDRAAGVEGLLKYTEVKHVCFDFN